MKIIVIIVNIAHYVGVVLFLHCQLENLGKKYPKGCCMKHSFSPVLIIQNLPSSLENTTMVHSFPLAQTLFRLSCVFFLGLRWFSKSERRAVRARREPGAQTTAPPLPLSSHMTSLPDEQRPLGCGVGAISAIIPPRPDQSRPCGPAWVDSVNPPPPPLPSASQARPELEFSLAGGRKSCLVFFSLFPSSRE